MAALQGVAVTNVRSATVGACISFTSIASWQFSSFGSHLTGETTGKRSETSGVHSGAANGLAATKKLSMKRVGLDRSPAGSFVEILTVLSYPSFMKIIA
jgi:hypothetical protein